MKATTSKLANVFNLSNYEAELYMAAQGEAASVSDLSSRSGIPRTAVYPPLKSLVAKGFLSPLREKGKRLKYRAIDPKHLKQIFSRRLLDLDEIIEQFGSSIFNSSSQVSVRYFEEREGVRLANDIFLQEAKSKIWKTFENPMTEEKFEGTKYFEEYMRARAAKGVSARVIIPGREHSSWMKEVLAKKEEFLLEVRLVSPDVYPLQAAIAISGEWILFMVANPKKPFALLVQNTQLAKTLESVHDMVWDRFNPTL